jgi:uncharacterized membrane protein required for colicin V production
VSAMHAFNVLDIIIAVALVGALALGYHRGFVAQLVSILGFFIAYVAAYAFYDDVAPVLKKLLPLHNLKNYDRYAFLVEGLNLDVYFYNAVAFAGLFVLAKVALSVLGGVLHLVSKAPGLNAVNKWSGALLALLEAVLIVLIVVHMMSILPSDNLQQVLSESEAAHFIMENMPDAAAKLQQLWNEKTS